MRQSAALLGLFLFASLLFGQSVSQTRLAFESARRDGLIQISCAVGAKQTRPSDLAKGPLEAVLFWATLERPDTLALAPETPDRWAATVAWPDTAIKAAVYAIQLRDTVKGKPHFIETDGSSWTPVLAVDDQGRPLPGAALALAELLATGLAQEPDANRIQQALDLELQNQPDNWAARRMRYAWLLREQGQGDAARQAIEQDLEETVRNAGQPNQALAFAAETYRLLGDEPGAQSAERQIVERHGQSPQAYRLRLQAILADTTRSSLADLDAFIDGRPPQEALESALVQRVARSLAFNDTSRLSDLGDRLLAEAQAAQTAGALATLSRIFSDKSGGTPRAVAYAQRAVDLETAQDDALRPPEMTTEEWRLQRAQNEARCRDALARALYKNGRFNAALEQADRAVALSSNPAFALHRGLILEGLDRAEEALPVLARAALLGGSASAEALDRFRRVWNAVKGDTLGRAAYLAQTAGQVERDFFQKVLAQRSVVPAPDFELEDLEGGLVRLSDQRGAVVVLCFWATWSQASHKTLARLTRLSWDWGEDILFLTVATDPDPAAVRQFMARRGLRLPVLLNRGTDRRFGIAGLPMVYVIDAQGQIHFTHRGDRPDLTSRLEVEMDDLLSRTR